jgi:hypothetical protein
MSRKHLSGVVAGVLMLVLVRGSAIAAPFSSERAFKGATAYLTPNRFQRVTSLTRCPDGSFWVVGADETPGFMGPIPTGRAVAWRLDAKGNRLGGDIILSRHDALNGTIVPMGVDTAGDLIVVSIVYHRDIVRVCLAKIGPSGLLGVVEPERFDHLRRWAFDPRGFLHVLSSRRADYVRFNLTSDVPRVDRTADFTQLFGARPSHLGGSGVYGDAYLLEAESIMIRALAYAEPEPAVSVYRFAMTDFRLLDSSRVRYGEHLYGSCAVRGGRMRIVPAVGGGYWLFVPDPHWRKDAAAGTAIYRLGSDLRPVSSSVSPAHLRALPLSSAPSDVEVDIQCPDKPSRYGALDADGSLAGVVTAIADFYGYGHDGQFYRTRESTAVAVRVPAPAAQGPR